MHYAAFFVIICITQSAFSQFNETEISCKPASCSNSSTSNTDNCFCDDQCFIYGDCCPDFKPALNKKQDISKNMEALSKSVECISEGRYGFYMVTSCPPHWDNLTISKKCHNSKHFFDLKINPNSNIEHVPLIKENIIYGNKYCAFCNGVEKAVKPMELNMNCHFTQTMDQTLPDMSCRYLYPYGIENLRECYPNIIDTCSSNWNDTEVSNRCHNYTMYVFSTINDSMVYKNPDCAYCNFQNDTSLSFCNTIRNVHADLHSPKWNFPDLFNVNGYENCTFIEMEAKRSYIPTLGVVLSIVFLILHLIIFSQVESMRNFPGKCVSSFATALLIGYVCYCLWGFEKGLTCLIIALTTYYSFLAAFCWMLLMSIDVSIATYNASCMLLRHNDGNEKKFIFYSIFCWGVPFLFVALSVIIELLPEEHNIIIPKPLFGRNESCWFGSGSSLLFFFVLPCSLIMTINIVLFTWTSYLIFSNRKETTKTVKKDHGDFKLYGRLAVFMGLTWMTGVFANYFQHKDLWIMFSLLNTTQGIFIFSAFSCKENNIREIRKKYSITFM